MCLAPKSNSAYVAIDAAIADVRHKDCGQVPDHLKDSHYSGASKLGHGKAYKYAHNYPNGYVKQQYLPTPLVDATYYNGIKRGLKNSYFTTGRNVVKLTKYFDICYNIMIS